MTITDKQQLTQRNANLDLPPLFAEWMRLWDLEDILAPILYTSVTWVKRCSPPNASPEDMAIACMDIALWIFYLDDCLKEDYNIVFEKCSKILDGHQPASGEDKLFHAYADVLKRVTQRGFDMQYYLKQRQDNLRYRVDLAKQRLQGRTNHKNLSFDEYFEIRQTTVAISYWITLWEILGDFYLIPQERTIPKVEQALRTISSAYLFHGDLFSLARDIKERTPNLVILHMEQNGGDILSSAQYIKDLIKQEVNKFQHLCTSVLNAAPSDRLRQYFEFLEFILNYITVPNLMENDQPDRYSSNLELAVIAYNQQTSQGKI
jgi:Terpene synthase family 2, C-terminal metal binding